MMSTEVPASKPECTPRQETNSKKRILSSPFDEVEYKKSCSQMASLTNVGLSETDIAAIGKSLKDSFKDDLLDLIEKSFKAQIQVIVDGVLSGLSAKIDHLEAENLYLKNENNHLKTRIEKLETASDDAEQYSRRNCLRISGIAESDTESTDNKVIEICDKLKLNISVNDIERSHRIGKPNSDKSRQIIVKFVSYRARRQFYKARTQLRNTGYRGVFVNEDLTRQRSHMLYVARQLVKKKNINSCWSSDGLIFIKDNEMKTRRILTSGDLLTYE